MTDSKYLRMDYRWMLGLRGVLGQSIAGLIATVLLVPSLCLAASFDCNRATTLVEKLICADQGLSQFDESLYKSYQEALRSVRDPAGLKREQAKWLREVRNLCTDSVCLEKEYRSRLAVLEKLLPVTIAGEKSAAPAETLVTPLKIIKKISDYRPVDYPILPYDGRLFFSQYDKSGNNFDILALDIENLSSEYILRGRPGAQFVAQNDKYLVASEKGRFANPLVVIDRASGKRISQTKLKQTISWARIKNSGLIAIQGTWMSGYATKAQALIFELPSLKVIKSLEITGGNDVQSWQGKILSLGYELATYDDDFNELFKISLPTRKRGEGVSCAATGPLRIHGDKAVIVANCGEILIYDLPTRQLERTIPSYAHFYAVAIIDGLIFTAPKSGPKQKDSAHVYDLYTGKELAVLPINATDLFAKGNRLLAVESDLTKPSPMTLYSVDTLALRSGQWRVEQVLKECQKAEALWIDSGDLYGAIGLCQSAGIEGLVEDSNNFKSILSVIRQYAFWLGKTLDRSRDAARILEALQRTAPDEQINRALIEVRLKTRVIEGNEVDSLTAEEQRTDFARALDIGNHLKGAETKNIEFGAFSNVFHFSGNRIYVGRYNFRSCSDCGASIGVLDRNTFKEIASIPIAPDDQEYQDYITSITSDENRIYASVEYRYEQAGRPNFFMIDKASLNILKKAQVEDPSTLIVESGQLLSCKKHEQGCKMLDPVTTKTVDAPDKVCVIGGERGDNTVARFPSDQAESSLFVALTKDYLVGHASWPKGTHYIFYPRVPDSKPISVQLSPPDLLDRPISISGNEILVFEGTRKGQLIKLVSVPTGVTKTLFGLPSYDRSRIPVPLLHNRTLFVALGRDLLIFDIKNNLLQRYIKNFIPAAFKDNGNGLDMNRINRLMIDRERLIALTSYGENSQIVPLSSLVVADR